MLLTGYIAPPVYIIPTGFAGVAALTIYYVQYRESLNIFQKLDSVLVYLVAIIAFVLIYSLLRERHQKAHVSQNESLKQLNRELEEQKAKAQAATVAKSDFLAKMSHEIRTPMTLILGATDVLEGNSSEKDKEKFLQILHKESNVLLNIVNDVLDISQIEAGKFELHTSKFDLVSLVEDTISSFEEVAEGKGISLNVDIRSSVAPAYEGDSHRVRQVLRNLLDNSIKYTSKGEVIIRVDQNLGNIQLIVNDTGQGMSQDEIQRVFQPFVQGEDSTKLPRAGFGLGLSIVRQLVDMMEGKIQVNSVPGEGTEFTVTLPLKAVEKPVLVKDQVVKAKRSLHILVVDDIKEIRELMGILLRKEGHAVSYARNGLEAISKRQAEHHDLIFMDIQMDTMNGDLATKSIRKWEQEHDKPRVPIVALTGNALKQDLERYLEADCDSCLVKPYKRRDLTEIVSRLA